MCFTDCMWSITQYTILTCGGGSFVYCIIMFLLCSYATVFYVSCDMNVCKLLHEITCFGCTRLNQS